MPDLVGAFTPPDEKPPNVVKAIVHTPPADVNDELTVVIPSFDEGYITEIRFWSARGTLLPSAGDEGVVGFLEDGEPWLISYWTADNTATGGVEAHTHAEADVTGLVDDLTDLDAAITSLTSALAAKQPLDSDLTAIAALSTTAFGRGLLALADAAALRASASVYSQAQVDAGFQPLDADLTALAALATTAYGRSVLETANAAALRTLADAQQSDSDLTAIAALTTTAFGRGLLTEASAATARSTLGLVIGTNVQAWDADLDAIAALTTDSFGRALLTKTSASAIRTYIDVPSNAEAILDALIDAKGDLLVGTAPDTVARKAVGTDGKFLKADSAQSDGLIWADPPSATYKAFRAYRAAALSLATGAVITFDTDTSADPDSVYNTTNGRAVPATAGWWRFSAGIFANVALTADKFWQVTLRKNGAICAYGTVCFQRGSATTPQSSVTDLVYCNGTTDYIEVTITHDNGGTVALFVGSASCYFAGDLVRPD